MIHQFTQLPIDVVKINERVMQHIYLSRCMKRIITNYRLILRNYCELDYSLQRRSLSPRGSRLAVCETVA
jgi:hypothetical protein